ncbi:MAG: hypothetical protein MUO72_12125 [Bacteroidales bacterium]|nr:hypothetical protein [Bacteroidales bacterium]
MKRIIIIYLLLLLTSSAFSQTEKLLVPSDLKQQTIITEPVTLHKGFFRAGLLLNYRVADRYFDSSGVKQYYRNSTWGSKSAYGITLQYGITDRLQVDLISEFMNTLQETQNTEIDPGTNTTVVTVDKQRGIGLGDSHLALKYQIIAEKERKFSLSGRLKATFPTGAKNPRNIKSENQYDLPVGDGTYALGLNLSARIITYPYSFSGYLTYTYNFTGEKIFITVDQIEKQFKLGNLFETGLSWNIHLNEWIVLGNEVNFYDEGEGQIEKAPSTLIPASWALSYEPSLIFQVYRFRLGESVKIPVLGKNVPADPLFVLMAQYIF